MVGEGGGTASEVRVRIVADMGNFTSEMKQAGTSLNQLKSTKVDVTSTGLTKLHTDVQNVKKDAQAVNLNPAISDSRTLQKEIKGVSKELRAAGKLSKLSGIGGGAGGMLGKAGMGVGALAMLSPELTEAGMLASALGPIFAGLSVFLLPIVAVVAAIGAGFLILYATSGTFRDVVAGIVAKFQEFFGWVGKVKDALMAGDFGKVGELLKKGLDDFVNMVKNINWTGVGETLKKIFTESFTAIVGFFKAIDWGAIWTAVVDALKLIFITLPAYLAALPWIEWATAAWTALIGLLGTIVTWLQSLDWGGMWAFIVALSATAWGAVITFLTSLDWGGFANTVWNALVTAIGAIVGWISGLDWGGYATTVWNALVAAIGQIIGWIKSLDWGGFAGHIWDEIKNALATFGTWLLTAAENFFTGLPGKIQSALSGFGQWLIDAASSFFSKIATAITDATGTTEALKTATEAAKPVLTALNAGVDAANAAKGKETDTGGKPISQPVPGNTGQPTQTGGVFAAISGGHLINIAEAGQPEAVIPKKYWWGIDPRILRGLPKFAGGGIIGSARITSPSIPLRSTSDSSKSETVQYNAYVSVDSENVTRKVFKAFEELERFHHL